MRKQRVALPHRLKTVLELLPPATSVADIGTDHGYLPVYLARRGGFSHLIATDLKPGPLRAALASAVKYGVAEAIELRMGDGLEPLDPGEVEVVVIAGMGEATIISLLRRDQCKARSFRYLVLQPMDGAARLRRFLKEVNWGLEQEAVVLDRGKFYQTLRVNPQSPFQLPNELFQDGMFTEEDVLIFGPHLLRRRDPMLKRMLTARRNHWQGVLSRISRSRSAESADQVVRIRYIIGKLEKVIQWLD